MRLQLMWGRVVVVALVVVGCSGYHVDSAAVRGEIVMVEGVACWKAK